MAGSKDRSNGYQQVAKEFISTRSALTGVDKVRQWSRTLAPRASLLDIGCGHGVPITQALIKDGFNVFAVDAAPELVSEFSKRFPSIPVECSAVEESDFFHRKFDGVLAWGLMFLLAPDVQAAVIAKVANALKRGGRFLFTSPQQSVSWRDVLTGKESVSLGVEKYARLLLAEGMLVEAIESDADGNDYYFVLKTRT